MTFATLGSRPASGRNVGKLNYRYTLSSPTWIGPGDNVTCTLLEECVTG